MRPNCNVLRGRVTPYTRARHHGAMGAHRHLPSCCGTSAGFTCVQSEFHLAEFSVASHGPLGPGGEPACTGGCHRLVATTLAIALVAATTAQPGSTTAAHRQASGVTSPVMLVGASLLGSTALPILQAAAWQPS